MTESKRQLICDAIETRSQRILIANGYLTNIGRLVEWWRSTVYTTDELPAINLRDMNEQTVFTIGAWKHFLNVEIDAMVFEAGAVVLMRKALADLQNAIKVDLSFGGLVEDVLLPQRDVIRPVLNEGRLVGVTFPIVIEYLTEPWDPDK